MFATGILRLAIISLLVLLAPLAVQVAFAAGADQAKLADGMQLAPEQIVPLEKFTRRHVGQQVAIVIGDRVVTVHKVREPIVGDRLQITRCTDNGCDVLFSALKNDLASRAAADAK
jgi:hypothetical protein